MDKNSHFPFTGSHPFLKPLNILLLILPVIVSLPFVFTLAGDAQVHLAIAESFTNDNPFQYNPTGEIVVASTSPFWTVLLIAFFQLSQNWAPLLLKISVLFAWIATAFLLYFISRSIWRFSKNWAMATTGLWLTHTIVVANALSGLENILAAFQLLFLYFLLTGNNSTLTRKRSAVIGIWIGWTLLTRPDGGIFALALLAIFFLSSLPQSATINNGEFSYPKLSIFIDMAIILVGIVIMILPWYVYQATSTGSIVTDSSLARLYIGRQGSITILPDRIYLHPKALLSLITGFLPLAAGFLVTVWTQSKNLIQSHRPKSWCAENFPTLSAILLFTIGFLFYTFVVGAESFGRYFLPLYPFLFLTGIAGIKNIYDLLLRHNTALANAAIFLTIVFFALVSSYDYYRRLVPGRFEQNNILDVIYGPAHLQYYSPNLADLIAAPELRTKHTDEFYSSLGVNSNQQMSIAVTEVQLRYFLDNRVDVLSLDGRTSANLIDYVDKSSGVPDFSAYFETTRPDFVHVNQWCHVGGWLAAVRPAQIQDNLVCQWQKKIAEMEINDQFEWNGHKVTFVAPEIVQIEC
jgi:hypothetical protein